MPPSYVVGMGRELYVPLHSSYVLRGVAHPTLLCDKKSRFMSPRLSGPSQLVARGCLLATDSPTRTIHSLLLFSNNFKKRTRNKILFLALERSPRPADPGCGGCSLSVRPPRYHPLALVWRDYGRVLLMTPASRLERDDSRLAPRDTPSTGGGRALEMRMRSPVPYTLRITEKT